MRMMPKFRIQVKPVWRASTGGSGKATPLPSPICALNWFLRGAPALLRQAFRWVRVRLALRGVATASTGSSAPTACSNSAKA